MKKINIIIPSYNYSEYLDSCLMSVISQKIDCPIDILISDDCSSDDSLGVLKRIKSSWESDRVKIFIFQQEKNMGEVKNVKFLLDMCDGDYIAYIDADDYWIDPNKLQKQIDFLNCNPDYVMSFTGHWIKYKDGEYAPSNPNQWLCATRQSEDITTETLLNGNWISYGRVWRNIDVIKDWMMDLPYMDWPMNYELSKFGKINYLDFPTGVYRQHSGGVYSELTREQEHERTNRVIEKLLIDYKNYKS